MGGESGDGGRHPLTPAESWSVRLMLVFWITAAGLWAWEHFGMSGAVSALFIGSAAAAALDMVILNPRYGPGVGFRG